MNSNSDNKMKIDMTRYDADSNSSSSEMLCENNSMVTGVVLGGEGIVIDDKITNVKKIEDGIENRTTSTVGEDKKKKKRKSPAKPWKKPKDMPRRPLSAYNLFFKDRREAIMAAAIATNDATATTNNEEFGNKLLGPKFSNTKRRKRTGVGFAKLARTIGAEWKALDSKLKAPYETQAAADKERYNKEMLVWRAKEKKAKHIEKLNAATVVEPTGMLQSVVGHGLRHSLQSFELSASVKDSDTMDIQNSRCRPSDINIHHHQQQQQQQQQKQKRQDLIRASSFPSLSETSRRQLLSFNSAISWEQQQRNSSALQVGKLPVESAAPITTASSTGTSIQPHQYQQLGTNDLADIDLYGRNYHSSKLQCSMNKLRNFSSSFNVRQPKEHYESQGFPVNQYLPVTDQHHHHLEPIPLGEMREHQKQHQRQRLLRTRSLDRKYTPPPILYQHGGNQQQMIVTAEEILPSKEGQTQNLPASVKTWFERNTNIDNYSIVKNDGDFIEPIRYSPGIGKQTTATISDKAIKGIPINPIDPVFATSYYNESATSGKQIGSSCDYKYSIKCKSMPSPSLQPIKEEATKLDDAMMDRLNANPTYTQSSLW